ncbi:hypothetical protein CH361_16895, partial [Leptospira brenneri]
PLPIAVCPYSRMYTTSQTSFIKIVPVLRNNSPFFYEERSNFRHGKRFKMQTKSMDSQRYQTKITYRETKNELCFRPILGSKINLTQVILSSAF